MSRWYGVFSGLLVIIYLPNGANVYGSRGGRVEGIGFMVKVIVRLAGAWVGLL